jgi:hypothetical protein
MYFDLQGNLESRELARGWLRDHSTQEQLAFLLPEASRFDAPLDAADHPVLPAGDREIAGGDTVRAPLDPQGRPGVAHGHAVERDVLAVVGDPGDRGALDRRRLQGQARVVFSITTPRRPPVIVSWSSTTLCC